MNNDFLIFWHLSGQNDVYLYSSLVKLWIFEATS